MSASPRKPTEDSRPNHVPDPRPVRDSRIAATALVHGLSVVTRNVADFALTEVEIINPWQATDGPT